MKVNSRINPKISVTAVDSIVVVVQMLRVAGKKLLKIDRLMFVAFFLILMQIMDGVLTSIGISRFGVSMEGNPFLRSLMANFGHIPTLTIVKLIAVAMVVLLACVAEKLSWGRKAMEVLCGIYLFGAVIPWTYILFVKPYIG